MSEIVVRTTPTPTATRRRWPGFHGLAEWFVHKRLGWAGLERRSIDLGMARVRYWIGGSGPPLMMLHGFGGDGAWAWHPQVPVLARRHTIVIPDLVWFGGSHSTQEDRSLYFQAEVQAALGRTLGWSRYDLCGISYGGLVAFTQAAMYHDQVRRLVLVSTPGPVYDDDDHHRILDTFGVKAVADVVIPSSPADVRRLLELAWTRPPPTPAFVLDETFQKVFTEFVDEKRELLEWLDTTRQFPDEQPDWELPHQTLLVWGENDPLFPVDVGHRLRDALDEAELLVIPGTRHAPNLERPAVFNQAVLEFLKR